jgi:Tol biopolymer transport system component
MDEQWPVWSPDGTRIVFQSARQGDPGLHEKLVSGTANDTLLLKRGTESLQSPTDWSHDGRFLAFTAFSARNRGDVWVLPLFGDRTPIPVVQTAFSEDSGAFSPDGRWIAYQSAESGQDQIYVQPFPATGGKYQVSKGGGVRPLWRADGRELFFQALDSTMMAAAIDTTRQFEAGMPKPLFQTGAAISRRNVAVTRDGQRFLVNTGIQRSSTVPLTVVVNWQAGLTR